MSQNPDVVGIYKITICYIYPDSCVKSTFYFKFQAEIGVYVTSDFFASFLKKWWDDNK